MSMSLQAEAGSVFQAQASAAAFFPAGLLSVPMLREPLPVAPAPRADTRLEVPLDELTFRHLKTAEEIASILHLRKEIQLVAASGADPAFVAREKKETSRVLSPLSNAAAPSSERFASFR